MSGEKKKRGKFRGIAVFGVGAALIVSAGIAGGVYAAQSGLIGGGAAKTPAKEAHGPAKGGEEGASYFAFAQGFTSNLKDSGSFVQMALSVATAEDGKVAEAVKNNEAALRSVVLMVVAEENAEILATKPGKEALQARLRDAMNAVMRAKTGSNSIDAVYFTGFVIQ